MWAGKLAENYHIYAVKSRLSDGRWQQHGKPLCCAVISFKRCPNGREIPKSNTAATPDINHTNEIDLPDSSYYEMRQKYTRWCEATLHFPHGTNDNGSSLEQILELTLTKLTRANCYFRRFQKRKSSRWDVWLTWAVLLKRLVAYL